MRGLSLVTLLMVVPACGGADVFVGLNDSGDGGGNPADAGSSDGGSSDGSPSDSGSNTCAQGTCVAAAPNGWEEPIEAYFGSLGNPPTCGVAFQGAKYVANDGLSFQPAACGCSCGGPSGVTCSATATFYCDPNGVGCNGNPLATLKVPANQCTAVKVSCPNVAVLSATAVKNPPSGGSCAANPSVGKSSVTWQNLAAACAPTSAPSQGSCATQHICAPDLDPSFKRCVAKAGDVSCPAGPYSDRHVEYGGFDDTRGCTACTCGSVTGASCTGTVFGIHSDANCSVLVKTGNLPWACTGPLPQGGGSALHPSQAQGGSCAASSVSPNGTVTPTQARTLCCIP